MYFVVDRKENEGGEGRRMRRKEDEMKENEMKENEG